MLRNMATHGTQTTQRSLGVFNRVSQKVKATTPTQDAPAMDVRHSDENVGGDKAVPPASAQAPTAAVGASTNANENVAPPSGSFTFSPEFAMRKSDGAGQELLRLDAMWKGQLVPPQKTTPIEETPLKTAPGPTTPASAQLMHGHFAVGVCVA